jgi:hypothetical protein
MVPAAEDIGSARADTALAVYLAAANTADIGQGAVAAVDPSGQEPELSQILLQKSLLQSW